MTYGDDQDNLINSDPIDTDPEASLACERWVHEESLHLVIMTRYILIGTIVVGFIIICHLQDFGVFECSLLQG